MHLRRVILCSSLLFAASVESFVAHRTSAELNIDRPAESEATAIKNIELQMPLPESEQKGFDGKSRGDAATERAETLNSKGTTMRSSDDAVFVKPALREQLKELMRNLNSDVVLVLRKISNEERNEIENVAKGVQRNGKQLNAIGDSASGSSSVTVGPTSFQLLPLNLKNIMQLPFVFTSPDSSPMRIWAIGSVAKFPPVLEHFLQRVQSYYSIYKYEDLSRPGLHNSGSGNQVIRVTKTTTAESPTSAIDSEVMSDNEVQTSSDNSLKQTATKEDTSAPTLEPDEAKLEGAQTDPNLQSSSAQPTQISTTAKANE